MKRRHIAVLAAVVTIPILLLASAQRPVSAPQAAGLADSPIPADASRCDLLTPLVVEVVPLTSVDAGRTVRFRVRARANFDTHAIERVHVEYEIPSQFRLVPSARSSEMRFVASRSADTEVDLWVTDDRPREIRAVVTAELSGGRTVAGVGVFWTGKQAGGLPPGATKRLVDPDGTEIVVYQGETVR